MRVLVVEDNPDTRNSLVEFLAARGLHVLAAPDGVTALHLAAQQAIDAYLIDIGLPGMDGFELARRVRQLAGGHDALLLAITGYGTPEDKRRAEEAGFDHHVIKPPDPDELCRLLNCPS